MNAQEAELAIRNDPLRTKEIIQQAIDDGRKDLADLLTAGRIELELARSQIAEARAAVRKATELVERITNEPRTNR